MVLFGLQQARLTCLPLETGGFLIGKRRGAHIEITGSTQQGSSDVATPSSFERADSGHSKRIHAAWRKTEGQEGMVGDWHSHPVGDGSYSGKDLRAWRTLIDSAMADCIGIILGIEALPRVFLIRRKPPLPWVDECRLFAEEEDDLVFGPD